MHLHILGSGDAFGSGGRAQTCLLLETGSQRLLVDCGATALASLRRAGIAPDAIDAIAVTHFHGDHFAGIPWMLLHALHVARNPRGLRIIGPAGIRTRVLGTLDLLFEGARGKVEEAIDHDRLATFQEYAPGTPVAVGEMKLVALEVRHSSSVACHGVRVESAGGVFAYSGDTEWTGVLVDLADGADLFLVECQAWDEAETRPGHLSYATIREHLAELRARRILLTHMGTSMLARAQEIDDPRVACAFDGLRLEL